MTKIDQFESIFKAADKTVFEYKRISVESVLVVTDLDESGAASLGDQVRSFLGVLGAPDSLSWRNIQGAEFSSVDELLEIVESSRPDLICTYRTLHSDAWRRSVSLGQYVDVLAQATIVPVLVLPHPASEEGRHIAAGDTDTVMAMTDHLTGDHRLVNAALRFTSPSGTLHLTNIEDGASFERYMDVISKIPSIDTNDARESILNQLIKEAHGFIESCKRVVVERNIDIRIEETIVLGQHLSEYKRLIEEKKIDLLVMNTRDADQLAMHGLAYPLAVELNYIPLLVL